MKPSPNNVGIVRQEIDVKTFLNENYLDAIVGYSLRKVISLVLGAYMGYATSNQSTVACASEFPVNYLAISLYAVRCTVLAEGSISIFTPVQVH